MRTVWIDEKLLLVNSDRLTSPFTSGALSAMLEFRKSQAVRPGLVTARGKSAGAQLLRSMLAGEGISLGVCRKFGKATASEASIVSARRRVILTIPGKRARAFDSLRGSIDYLMRSSRIVTMSRKTRETKIDLELDLDGTGANRIVTGIGFFDHMLEQLAKHSLCDMKLKVKGDLEIDEHHTVEDVALVIGQAIDRALGERRGISRYGFEVPMDEALASVAIDLSARPILCWNAGFKREFIGGMPTEMFKHFFKSLADAARITLHISVRGENEHHKIEAIFKAFARALRMAIARDGRQESLPSTKGVL
jgi:imidazoleglycerol phosphate dehydratase HisB